MHILKVLHKLLFISILLLAASCSGGGGGGNDSKDSSGNPNERTTKTAVRLINSSVDAVPLGISSNGTFLYKTSYMGDTKFGQISATPGVISISVADRVTEVLRAFNIDAKEQTEYTVFYYGTDKDGNINHRIFSDPVVRPEKGFGRIQVLHGLSDVSGISAQIGDVIRQDVAFGQSSGFVDLPSGDYTITVNVTRGGVLVQQLVNVPDQGEITFVVSGKLDYDFVTAKAYLDFD